MLLSDVLPFEIPLSFSNRHFYDLIIRLKVRIDAGGKICYDRNSRICKELTDKVFNGDLKRADNTVSLVLSILLNGSRKTIKVILQCLTCIALSTRISTIGN